MNELSQTLEQTITVEVTALLIVIYDLFEPLSIA